MSTTTTNLGLIKPELTDVADITAMNQNWDIIDENLKSPNAQTFTALYQIGLTEGYETIQQIAGALPVNSMLYYTVSATSNVTEFPNSNYGLLVVDKTLASRIVFTFTNAQGVQYVGYYTITTEDEVWTGWNMTYSSKNVTYGTGDLTAGSATLVNGNIYLCYE